MTEINHFPFQTGFIFLSKVVLVLNLLPAVELSTTESFKITYNFKNNIFVVRCLLLVENIEH